MKKSWLIGLLIVLILVVLGIVAYFIVNTDVFENKDNSIEFSFEDCISLGNSQDDCYIQQARAENNLEICDFSVSAEKRNDCYDVIVPENYYVDEKDLEGEGEVNGEDSLITGNVIYSSKDQVAYGEYDLNAIYPDFDYKVIEFADNDEDITIETAIDNAGSGAKVYLMYKNSPYFGSEGWNEREMSLNSAGKWQAVLPLSEMTPFTNLPNMIANGGMEEWDSEGNSPESWRVGWATIGRSSLDNGAWKLRYSPMYFTTNANGGDDRGQCTPENSMELKGSINSDVFVIEGDYIGFIAIQTLVHELNEPTERTDFVTPWGERINSNADYRESTIRPRVQLIDAETGEVLEDSVIYEGLDFGVMLEYEWNVSNYNEKRAYIKIIDNDLRAAGIVVGSFLQLKINDTGFDNIPFSNGEKILENINFEKGDFSNWNTNTDFLWRLVKEDRSIWPIDEADYKDDDNWKGAGTAVQGRLFDYHKGTYNGWRPLVGDLNNDGRFQELTSARSIYVAQNYADEICVSDGQCHGLIQGIANRNYSTRGVDERLVPSVFNGVVGVHFEKYLKMEEGFGDYVLTSEYNAHLKQGVFKPVWNWINPNLRCPGTTCNADRTCNCETMDCEINLHNSWTADMIAQTPYEFTYKARTDKDLASAQLVLWCDYVGEKFFHEGYVDEVGYTMDVESRGKFFAGGSCKIGTEWTECKSVIMAPKDITKCGNFRLVTGKMATHSVGGGNTLWLDDLEVKPIRTGIRYYIKVVNDEGIFSSSTPDSEKEWAIDQGSFNPIFRRKPVKFFAEIDGSDNWRNYEVEFDINGQESLDPLGSWSLGALLFRAEDKNNYYKLDINFKHNLVELRKSENGIGETIYLNNPIPRSYGRKIKEIPARDYRPFFDERVSDKAIDFNRWYHVKVRVNNNEITVYLDNRKIIEETNTAFANGGIGLTGYQGDVLFDNIIVRSLSGQTLFQDSFNNLNKWDISSDFYKRADFITVGQESNWQQALEVNDFESEAGVKKWNEWNFDSGTATGRYVALKINDGGLYCNRNGEFIGEESSGYFFSTRLYELEILDESGENVLINKSIIDTNVKVYSNINDGVLGRDSGGRVSSIYGQRDSSMLKYEPMAYVVFDLEENKQINKFRLYSSGVQRASTWSGCNPDQTADIRDFTIEVLQE
jgi:hypothetical protein